MNCRLRRFAFLLFGLVAAAADNQWPQFRGPNGSGVDSSAGYPVEFSPSKNVVWKTAIPFAQSSPVLAGGHVYLTASEPAKLLTLDKLKIPPGGILVLVEEARDVLQLFPKMVLLTPEKFQEMMERINTLERQVKGDKKLPNVCKLAGRLDGDVVRLTAEYKFTTDRPQMAVFLGGQGAVITEAKLAAGPGTPEGPLPFLDPGDNGYSVQVEHAGEHVLTGEKEGGFSTAIFGTAEIWATLKSFGPVMPRIGVGWKFPMNDGGFEEMRYGIIAKVILEF